MDVRSIDQVKQKIEHHGTVPVWWMVGPDEMRDATRGTYLEYVTEFEVVGGGEVESHNHDSHEFYYVVAGRGTMVVDGEERAVHTGDLVYIPPLAMHSIRPATENAPIRCFSFAVANEPAAG